MDTGIRPGELVPVGTLGGLANAPTWTITRLEWLAETVASSGVDAAGYADGFRAALHQTLTTAVGCKTIVAYRHGLDFDPTRPSEAEVVDAAGRWLQEVAATGRARLTDPVLLRFGIWEAVHTGRPLQFHVGYGDTDLELHRADPALLTRFLRATEDRGVPVLLLHNYPYHRHASYLAQVFEHVFMDVGLATHNTGALSRAVIREALELVPFAKMLYSSDAFGLPELYSLSARLFRQGLGELLEERVANGDASADDADRIATLILSENARRVYRLDPPTPP
jgi:predicted TIM-barrel fold metal-dependent hydrolase